MKFIAKIVAAIRPIRFLFAALVCTTLFWTSVAPAQAANLFNNSKSKPTDGVEQLQKIDDKAQQEIDNPAMSLEEIEKRAQGGLNEVQGAADKDKMHTSNSSEPAIGKKIEKALDKVTK
jgi:hypothetical protein